MKILWITEFFPASSQGEITGGVEARCFFVSKYLEKWGHQVDIVAERTNGKRWTHLSFGSLFVQLNFLVRISFDACKKIFSDFEIVEGTNYGTYVIAWLLGTLRRKPVVFWYPDVFIGDWVKNIGWIGLLGEIGERFILKLPVNLFLAISETTKNKLIKQGVPNNLIKVVACGADIRIRTSHSLLKKYDIAVVSRLVGYKRVEDFIKAAADIKEAVPNFTSAVVGQGPEKRKLEAEVTKLGLNKNVIFLGYLPSHKDVLRQMELARVFCHPSTVEGFGIVVIEAMALGVPVVAANIPVISEITKNGKGALLFKPQDCHDLATMIIRLLSDRKLYKQKVEEARALAGEYTWEKIARATEKTYENLHAD